MIMSCSRLGHTAATPLYGPFKTKGKPRLQMQLCTCVQGWGCGGVLKLVCQPLSISKSLTPNGTLFYPQLLLIYLLPSHLSAPVLPHFFPPSQQ